jgi:hypothetical protein
VGFRSYTFNEGYPRWSGAGAGTGELQDGGTCTDPRNASYKISTGTRSGNKDLERVRIATTGSQLDCVANVPFSVGAVAPFSQIFDCASTPQIGLPYDKTVRVLRADVTAQVAGQASVLFCGRFSTNEFSNATPACYGLNDGVTVRQSDSVQTTCTTTNLDDGWYIDDFVVYSCDKDTPVACDQSMRDPTIRYPKNFWCHDASNVCCSTGAPGPVNGQKCVPGGGGCVNCRAPLTNGPGDPGEQSCNTVCCAAGYYCADFENSYCVVSNTDKACGKNRVDCTQTSQTCGLNPLSAGGTSGTPRDCAFSDIQADVTNNTTNCMCATANTDVFCGNGKVTSAFSSPNTPRRNCTIGALTCKRCDKPDFANLFSCPGTLVPCPNDGTDCGCI